DLSEPERDGGQRQQGERNRRTDHGRQRQRHGDQRRFMMAVALKSWKALGTSVHVVTTDEAALGRAEVAVSDVLLDVDSTYSRFRTDSELSHLNASAGRPVGVS